MIPINNSDTAWLIVADYNQENGKFHEELREDVLNVNVNDWHYCYHYRNGVGGIEIELICESVGDIGDGVGMADLIRFTGVGDPYEGVSVFVGGNNIIVRPNHET